MESIVKQFYSAFNRCDAEDMVSCYHDEVTFSDPAFGMLQGEHAKNMWKMLCDSQRGRDFKVELIEVKIQEDSAMAQWEAFYNFSKTGRRVHNIVNADFLFKDGKIFKHSDYFNLHKWARQALGLKGLLLGNTSFFRKQIQKQTHKMLLDYERKK